jgi:hypothetical protein
MVFGNEKWACIENYLVDWAAAQLGFLLLDDTAEDLDVFYTYCFQTLQIMSFNCWQVVGPFFLSLKMVSLGKHLVSERRPFRVQQQSRRPTIAVQGLPSSFKAIILTFSATESLPIHLVIFLPGILLKSSVRRKRCDVTAAYSGPLEVTG